MLAESSPTWVDVLSMYFTLFMLPCRLTYSAWWDGGI